MGDMTPKPNTTPTPDADRPSTAPATPDAGPTSDAAFVVVSTSRFGQLEVEPGRIMRFDDGLLGFPEAREFALIQTGDDPCFFWLQSCEDPQLAFVVCDPAAFVPGYDVSQVPLRAEGREELGLEPGITGPDLDAATQVLAICNRVGDWLTGNLLGPIVVNVLNFRAKQVVLAEKRWGTRHPLLRLAGEGAGTSGETDLAGSIGVEDQSPLRKTG
jgi:flagellar assembly factor FliW